MYIQNYFIGSILNFIRDNRSVSALLMKVFSVGLVGFADSCLPMPITAFA
jgi:hypothetical protein